MTLTFIIITGFILWFTLLWIFVLSIMSVIGGWKKLSRLYPPPLSHASGSAVKFSMCSAGLGFVRYRNIVNITFTQTGIIMEVIKIFSFMHRPVFLPYEKMKEAQKGKFFSTYIKFMIEDKKITIYGKAGDELFSRIPDPLKIL
jgi:hypothetical protein